MDAGLAIARVNRNCIVIDLVNPEQTAMVYARVEVMDLEGELALENVQSNQGEGAVMVVTIFADVGALHKAQVHLKHIARRLPCGQVGACTGPLDKSDTDVAVEIGDQRGVILGWIGAVKGWITRQQDVVYGRAWAEGLDAAGDGPGAGSMGKNAAFESEGGAECEGVDSGELEELSPGEGIAERAGGGTVPADHVLCPTVLGRFASGMVCDGL